MKYLFIALLLFSSFAIAIDKSCVIVSRHQKKAAEVLTRWTQPKPFDYVEGNFPNGMKFKSEVSDKMVRQIQDKGGKVIILSSGYKLPDLEDARNACKTFQGGK